MSVRTGGFQSGGAGFSDKRQTNKATIGSGDLVSGGEGNPDIAGLNRDVNNANINVKDTGVDLSLDAITSSYDTVKSIANDTVQIGMLGKTSVEMIDAADQGDASLGETVDAIALGFNSARASAKIARSESQLASLEVIPNGQVLRMVFQ